MFWIVLLPLLLHPGYACMRPALTASVTNPSTTAPPVPPAPAPSSSGTNVDVSSEPANRNETTGFPSQCSNRLAKKDKRILFLGNSYTYYNDLPGQVGQVAAAAGYKAEIASNSKGGWSLASHVEASLGLLSSGSWDVVVLQDQSQRPSFSKDWVASNILPDSDLLLRTLRDSDPCSLPVFFLTWGKRDGDRQNCHSGNYFCSFEGIQSRLTESYTTFAFSGQPARVAPVGEAWSLHPDRAVLFSRDGSHPSPQGTYLAALTIFETIWGESSVGNSFTPVQDYSSLQALAHSAVASRRWAWPQAGGPPCPSCLPGGGA